MEWQDISSAPRDGAEILVWFDHSKDTYHDIENPSLLTDYAANAEGGEFLDGSGIAVAKWCDALWEAEDEYGNGYWIPAFWFSRGDASGYEAVCNPTHWMPLPHPPEPNQ